MGSKRKVTGLPPILSREQALPHYWPVSASPVAPLLTKRSERSKSKISGSPNRTRTETRLVNSQLFEGLGLRVFSTPSASEASAPAQKPVFPPARRTRLDFCSIRRPNKPATHRSSPPAQRS